MLRGHVTATVFLVWHARFCEKSMLWGQNSVSTTCCWFEFLRHEAGTECSIFNIASCVLLLQTVLATTETNQYLFCVHQLASYAYTWTGLSSLHVPATCSLLCAHLNKRPEKHQTYCWSMIFLLWSWTAEISVFKSSYVGSGRKPGLSELEGRELKVIPL